MKGNQSCRFEGQLGFGWMGSVEFFAGFVSGIAGLLVGSPLDILKTNEQNSPLVVSSLSFWRPITWTSGLLMPILGLGFLNAILFWSYGIVTSLVETKTSSSMLLLSFSAGFISGICVCVVSVPTEVVKVRAQTSQESSVQVIHDIFITEGLYGFWRAGVVTVARDAIGYAFYFLAYDGFLLFLAKKLPILWAVLLSGGLAGCISWFSIFPLDTIKTRLQATINKDEARNLITESIDDRHPRGSRDNTSQVLEALTCTRQIYREGGVLSFFRGLSAAMLRAFLANAVIFYVDRWIRQAMLPSLGRAT